MTEPLDCLAETPIFMTEYLRCIFLTANIGFATVAKVINVFLFLQNLKNVMNVLSVLRIMQKWHAETREGPVFMQLKFMSLLLDYFDLL